MNNMETLEELSKWKRRWFIVRFERENDFQEDHDNAKIQNV